MRPASSLVTFKDYTFVALVWLFYKDNWKAEELEMKRARGREVDWNGASRILGNDSNMPRTPDTVYLLR